MPESSRDVTGLSDAQVDGMLGIQGTRKRPVSVSATEGPSITKVRLLYILTISPHS